MYSHGTIPIRRLLFKNKLSTPAKTGDNSPVKKLWLKSTIDPPPYDADVVGSPINFDGTRPDKLFRCKNIDDSVGLNSSAGMGPLNWFMLKSRYTNSESSANPLSGPRIELRETDR